MVARVQRFQSLRRDMRINLRGRNIAVSEQHLYDTQIRTMIEQVGCESMAQCVGREW